MNYLSTVHTVKKGENLESIGRKYCFKNPGPIYYFPPNKHYFKKRNADELMPGDIVHVPWHPDYLDELIYRKNYVIKHLPESLPQRPLHLLQPS